MAYTLVLLRHGESEWNAANLFTGWHDADLSDKGRKEASTSGRLLREAGILPDILHTSVLVRAIRTADLALDEAGLQWLPVTRHWRLNERHYGDLTGKNKKETADRFGPEQLKVWRRSYDVPPPPVDPASPYHPINDPRYRTLPPEVLPAAECLKDVLVRMLPWWHDVCIPDLAAGRLPLVLGPRQQPAGPGEASRRHSRRRHRRAQHPDRNPAGLRARRVVPADRCPAADTSTRRRPRRERRPWPPRPVEPSTSRTDRLAALGGDRIERTTQKDASFWVVISPEVRSALPLPRSSELFGARQL